MAFQRPLLRLLALTGFFMLGISVCTTQNCASAYVLIDGLMGTTANRGRIGLSEYGRFRGVLR